MKQEVTFDDFLKLDIRVGEVVDACSFVGVKRPAYKLWVYFGEEIGVKKTSAQITDCYEIDDLIGMQVLGVVNFPPKQIKDFMSEFLLLGVYSDSGVVLIKPDKRVSNGDILG